MIALKPGVSTVKFDITSSVTVKSVKINGPGKRLFWTNVQYGIHEVKLGQVLEISLPISVAEF